MKESTRRNSATSKIGTRGSRGALVFGALYGRVSGVNSLGASISYPVKNTGG
jgi:hypothetical protein